MGSACVKVGTYSNSGDFHMAWQTEPNFGIQNEDCDMNEMAMNGQSRGTADASERDKPRHDTTNQEVHVNEHGKRSKESTKTDMERDRLKYDSGMRCMVDKIHSQFNYFPPFTKNSEV